MEPIPFIEFSLYQMFHMFIFWAFIGWGIEVCWMTLETGEYQNRGFLNMPICPIYGFGVIMVTVFFRPVSHTVIPLFVVTSILCTTFELLVGLGMEKLFGARWWDYSHERYNYKGYICLKISILWGMGCVIVIRLVQPMVEKFIDMIPVRLGLALIILWSVLIVIDLISSICAVNKLNNRLKQLDEISKIMLLSAVKIGENLSQETLDVKGKYDRFIEAKDAKTLALKQRYEKIVSAADFKVSEWKDKYEGLADLRDRSVERLLRAFPHMRSISYSEAMEILRRRLNNRISVSGIKQSPKSGDDKNNGG
ncbi:MAG: putative ABC transporter permease [Oscillospiraceae bacterium]|nr:putative ABC transporter permease [Oscillospiraceae bacterium]